MRVRFRLPDSERVQPATIDRIARLVKPSPTRAMCELSIRTAARTGAIAPAVVAGLLLALQDGVISAALDDARHLARFFDGFDTTVARLEAIEKEERGDDGANG